MSTQHQRDHLKANAHHIRATLERRARVKQERARAFVAWVLAVAAAGVVLFAPVLIERMF